MSRLSLPTSLTVLGTFFSSLAVAAPADPGAGPTAATESTTAPALAPAVPPAPAPVSAAPSAPGHSTSPLVLSMPAAGQATAPDSSGPTLFGSPTRRHRFGAYGAPSFGVTSLNGHAAYNFGARGAFIIDDRFGIGLAGYAMGWDGSQGDNPNLSKDRELIGGYGGLLLEYRILPQFPVHGLIDTTFGAGFVCTSARDSNTDDDDSRRHECDDGRGFGVIEPTANIEVNLTRFMRLSAGGGYRFAFAPDRDGISGHDLSGLTMRTNLQFGWF